MFLVEEKTSLNGRCSAAIYMRPDGLFEGRIYRSESEPANHETRSNTGFEVCGITETLPRLETIVDEELGL
jgi:hypothetical protein